MSENTLRNIVYLRSRNIDRRNLAEKYCKAAETLPTRKRMLFHLYYRYGYSSVEIGELLGRHSSSIQRRLHRIEKKIEMILNERNKNGSSSSRQQ